jgi:hypothetical protein
MAVAACECYGSAPASEAVLLPCASPAVLEVLLALLEVQRGPAAPGASDVWSLQFIIVFVMSRLLLRGHGLQVLLPDARWGAACLQCAPVAAAAWQGPVDRGPRAEPARPCSSECAGRQVLSGQQQQQCR